MRAFKQVEQITRLLLWMWGAQPRPCARSADHHASTRLSEPPKSCCEDHNVRRFDPGSSRACGAYANALSGARLARRALRALCASCGADRGAQRAGAGFQRVTYKARVCSAVGAAKGSLHGSSEARKLRVGIRGWKFTFGGVSGFWTHRFYDIDNTPRTDECSRVSRKTEFSNGCPKGTTQFGRLFGYGRGQANHPSQPAH